MMKNKFLAGLVTVALWSSCLATGAENRSASEVNPHGLVYSDVVMTWPDFSEPFQRDGVVLPPERILRVKRGVHAQDVRALLGEPLSVGTGALGTEWDYNLKLDLADEDYIVCQYKVVFEDESMTVKDTVWRRYQCKLAMETVKVEPAPVQEPKTIELSGDFLFDFDDASLAQQGFEVLNKLAIDILATGPSNVTVVGHTDRLGSRQYNQQLSERRAHAVANYLTERGVPAEWIRSYGRGMDEQVKACEGDRITSALRECLRPNRRVSITVEPLR